MEVLIVRTSCRWWQTLYVTATLLHAVMTAPPRPSPSTGGRGRTEFSDIGQDGSYRFGYSTGDSGQHYHSASATADNTVAGQFGYKEPGTGRDLKTTYTAGRRGFRANGPHIARRMNLSQNKIPYNPPVSQDSPHYNPSYDTYFDPNEDPSYEFGFNTPVYNRNEKSDSRGDVNGHYTFYDDVGLRHDVEYEAGSRTGFHVKTPYPESNSIANTLFFRGPPASKTGTTLRGHTAIQRFNNGAYRFTAIGPDQRRQEESDAVGNVRGSYTYLDDKGIQRTTEYIAGPNIGYKVINSELSPQNSNPFPYLPPPYTIPTPFEPNRGTEDGSNGNNAEGSSGVGNFGNPSKDDDIFGLPEGLKTAASGSAVQRPQDTSSKDDKNNVADVNKDEKVEDDELSVFDVKPSISTEIQPPKEDDNESSPNGFTDSFDSNVKGNENDDIFGPNLYNSEKDDNFLGSKESPSGIDDEKSKSTSDEGFLTSDDEPASSQTGFSSTTTENKNTKIPYGNCCSLAGRGNVRYNVPATRQADKRFHSNKFSSDFRNGFRQSASKDREQEQDEEERFLGFPPGVAVRARVQSIDLPKYGSRLPPPGVALDYSTQFSRKDRRQIRQKYET